MMLLGLVQSAASSDTNAKKVDPDANNSDMTIIIVAVVITLCILMCCTCISKALSKPKGVDEHWTSEQLSKTNKWLDE
jgi:hypothetical protein